MKSKTGLLIVLGIIVLLFFWGCGSYNKLVTKEQQVETAWSNVETNYQRRTDLYSSVVKTIEGSANFEKGTLTEVIEARSNATQVQVNLDDPASLEKFRQAQSQLQGAFSRLLVTVERYPELKTTQAFQGFQAQIEGTENRINVARQDYNATVKAYNLQVKRFPGNIFAGIFGYDERAYYEAEEGAEDNPDIEFDIK